jgi:pimeloyl-ACP methyl ester carboxylesterase
VTAGVDLVVDHWPSAGVGPAFLLVHGLASNARMWDGVAARLAERGREVLTVDLRGHGRSSKPEAGYDVATVADDLAALLGRIGLDRPVVAGQSWGGNVVLELAARQPGSVGGIALVDGGWIDLQSVFPAWQDCRASLAPPRLLGRPAVELEGHIRNAHGDWPETGIRGAMANFEVRPDGTIAPWLTFDRHMAVLRGLWEHRPATRYAAVRAPTLLVPADTGEADRVARKRADVATALAALPSAKVHWVVGDHDIHAQHPSELAVMLEELATTAVTL